MSLLTTTTVKRRKHRRVQLNNVDVLILKTNRNCIDSIRIKIDVNLFEARISKSYILSATARARSRHQPRRVSKPIKTLGIGHLVDPKCNCESTEVDGTDRVNR